MAGFVIAFVAIFLLGAGGRDQVLIAGLTSRLGKRVSLLAAALVAATLTIAAAAWLASWLAAQLDAAAIRPLAALALGLAGLEMAMVRQSRIPAEPTRSLGAMTLVLLTFQAADAVRLATFALVLMSGATAPAAAGAILGSMAALAAGWALGDKLSATCLTRCRRWLGIAVMASAGTFLLILR